MWKMFLSFSTDVYVIFCNWNISMKCTDFMLICHLLMLTYFLCAKCSCYSQLMFMWFSCTKHIDEVDALHPHLSYTASDYLLMLTIFHVQNVLTLLDWCLCDFLLLKHINEVDGLHLHLSLTDVDIFFVWKIFYNFNTAFDYLLMLTYFSCAKCSYPSWLMFMWFSVTETYRWSGWTSSSFVTYWCWHIFCVENILQFQYCFWLFTDVDIFFMCKMFLSFLTDVYVIFCYWNISMKWMDFIFICHWHIFCVENILWFQYCFWLFTDVDIFFMCKMFLSFSTDVYVIFCYWNISIKCTHFIFISHLCWHIFMLKMSHNFNIVFDYLLMLIIFPVQNVLIMFLSYSRISILLLIIYWCWLFFMCQSFFTKVSLSSGHSFLKKVSLSSGCKVSLSRFP